MSFLMMLYAFSIGFFTFVQDEVLNTQLNILLYAEKIKF